MPRTCKLCRQRPAAVPDREATGADRWTACVCGECHAGRLCCDMERIMAAHVAKADGPDDAPTPDDASLLTSWSGHDWYADLGGEGGHE